MILNEQAFWAVIGLFYLAKQIRFLDVRGAYAFVAVTGGLEVIVPSAPFETTLGLLLVLNPFTPFRVTLAGRWGALPPKSDSDLRRGWALLAGATRRLAGVRVVASVAWLLLFVLGPVLTWQMGLGRTLLVMAPGWLVVYGLAAYFVLFGRLTSAGININRWIILFECLVCPGYVPALPAILTHDVRLSVDMCQLAKQHQSSADWGRLEAIVERRIVAELIDDPSREAEMNQYRSLVLQ